MFILHALRPFFVHRSCEVIDTPENTQSTHHDNGLFIDHIVLVANKVRRDRGTSGENGCLGNEGRSWKSIDYGLRPLCRWFRGDIGRIAMGGQDG